MGNRVFGCDICNEVCPYNIQLGRRARAPAPQLDIAAPYLADLAGLDEAGFQARFAATPVARPGRERLQRNTAVALGNWGAAGALGPLEALLAHEAPLVRAHAAWGLGRLQDGLGQPALGRAWRREADAAVRAEIRAALAA
jgi:epoxyqueuosine reductase